MTNMEHWNFDQRLNGGVERRRRAVTSISDYFSRQRAWAPLLQLFVSFTHLYALLKIRTREQYHLAVLFLLQPIKQSSTISPSL